MYMTLEKIICIYIYPVTHKSSDGYVKRQGYKLALFRGGGVQSL